MIYCGMCASRSKLLPFRVHKSKDHRKVTYRLQENFENQTDDTYTSMFLTQSRMELNFKYDLKNSDSNTVRL